MQIRKDRLKQLLDDGPPDRLLDVATGADRLSVEPETFRRYIEQGHIPHVRLGRAIRVRESDVNRIIAFGLADKDNLVALRGDIETEQGRDGEGS
jgi:excisionase family DNA binding protein